MCINRVFVDVFRIVLIYMVVWGAHAMCAWSMFKPFQEAQRQNRTTNYTLVGEDFKTVRSFLISGAWRMLFADNHDSVHVKALEEEDEDFSLEFSHAVGIAVWMSYQIIMTVLMINILVAILNTSYSEVWQRAESEWKYERTLYVVIHNNSKQSHFFLHVVIVKFRTSSQAEFIPPRASFPWPFRPFYHIARAAYKYKRQNTEPEGNEKNRREKIRYFQLMQNLIQRRREHKEHKKQTGQSIQ